MIEHARTVMVVVFLIALSLTTSSAQAALIVTTDIIADSERTHFNGFEGASFNTITGQNYATYIEGGVRVTQVNEKITTYIPSVATTFMAPGFEGQRSWYASGGDYGYTNITKEDGSSFGSIGFLRGSGWVTLGPPYFSSYVYYELWNDGVFVQSGSQGPYNYFSSYIGFIGDDFDEVRLSESLYGKVDHFGNGDPWELGGQGAGGPTYNALAIDSIEVKSIPEPSTLALITLAITTLFVRAYRTNK